MNSAPLNSLINELTKISEKHDNCLKESLKLYQNQDFEDRELEPAISNVVDIDRPIKYKKLLKSSIVCGPLKVTPHSAKEQ